MPIFTAHVQLNNSKKTRFILSPQKSFYCACTYFNMLTCLLERFIKTLTNSAMVFDDENISQ